MKIVREKLYEEFYGEFITEFGADYEIYKNPKNIKNMGWARGVSDSDGNLYVAIPSNKVIHEDIYNEIGYIDESDVYDRFSAIAWQQYGNTNKFYLGEGYYEDYFYEEDETFMYDEILPAYEAVKTKNPQYEFILKNINNT